MANDKKPTVPLTRRQAVKRVMGALDRLPSDDDRREVLRATAVMYPEQTTIDHAIRGEVHGNSPTTTRRA
jgi:hypothetical protein